MIQQLEPPYHQFKARLQRHQGQIDDKPDDILVEATTEELQETKKDIKAPAPQKKKNKKSPPLAQQRLLPALGWEDWEPSGRRPRRSTVVKPIKGRGKRGGSNKVMD